MVRIPLAAADSLAAIRARSRFGIAMAAMIRMIATTISNSISEKPFCFRIIVCPRLRLVCDGRLTISLVTIALSLPEKCDESDARLCRQALPFRLLAGRGSLSRVVIDLNLTLHGCSIDNIWHLKRDAWSRPGS